MTSKKTTVITTALALLMAISPLTIIAASSGGDSSTFYYTPLNKYVQASPEGVSPQGIPLCGSGAGKIVCYSPDFMKKAYNISGSLDGTGQTIIIVDAYGSPTITTDLTTFDTYFGLPAPPSFTILCPKGGCPMTLTAGAHNPIGWGVET